MARNDLVQTIETDRLLGEGGGDASLLQMAGVAT
jgi:hypothetical protein